MKTLVSTTFHLFSFIVVQGNKVLNVFKSALRSWNDKEKVDLLYRWKFRKIGENAMRLKVGKRIQWTGETNVLQREHSFSTCQYILNAKYWSKRDRKARQEFFFLQIKQCRLIAFDETNISRYIYYQHLLSLFFSFPFIMRQLVSGIRISFSA